MSCAFYSDVESYGFVGRTNLPVVSQLFGHLSLFIHFMSQIPGPVSQLFPGWQLNEKGAQPDKVIVTVHKLKMRFPLILHACKGPILMVEYCRFIIIFIYDHGLCHPAALFKIDRYKFPILRYPAYSTAILRNGINHHSTLY